MKLFCLLIEETNKGEVFETRIPIVTTDKARAEKFLKEFVEDNRQYYEGDGFVIEEDSTDYFHAYEDGRYTENHVCASIVERELDKLNWNY